MRLRAFCAALVVAALALGGCDKLAPNLRSPFNAVDITGAPIGADFQLVDQGGRPRSLSEFRGKVVVVTFGFTHCPDVCPMTLADFAAARKQLGADASRVQVLFVTVDPKRDTQEVLAQYVPAFDPGFIGLRGSEDAIEKVTKAFKIYAHRREGKTPGDYTIDHSAQSFVYDPQGKVRLAIGYGMEPAKIAADLRLLMN